MIQDTFDALRQVFHPRFREVFVQTLLCTILILVVAGVCADRVLLDVVALVAAVGIGRPWLGWLDGPRACDRPGCS